MQAFRAIARPLVPLLALSMFWLGLYAPIARAALVGTEQAVSAEQVQQERQRLMRLYEREDVMSALRARGVDPSEAKARVASLSDAEVHAVAGRVDELQAGSGAGEVLLVVLLVLIITDLLGYTDIFSFVHPAD